MERPYKGRAILQDNFTELQITIPAKRNWFIIVFLGAWLGGWLMGELFVSGFLIRGLTGSPAGFFVLFWLIAWTTGGFFAFRFFLWNLTGREVITIGQGMLTIEKRGALLVKPKTYDLSEVKDIRAQEDNSDYSASWGARRNGFGSFYAGGTLRFDYGLQTVKFAGGLDEAEAKYILEKLKERHLLTEKNYL